MGTHYEGSADAVRALDAYIKLMRAANTVRARLESQLKGLGLTENQLGVLESLLHLGPLHQHQIGRKLLISRANITLIVDQLSRRKLVLRERERHDRRLVRVRLTAEGRRFILRIFPAHAERIAEAFSVLGAREQQQLGQLCRKLGLGNAEQRRP